MREMPKGQVCTNDCDHLAEPTPWVGHGSAMDLVHGNYTWWCTCCMIDAQLEDARASADRIPQLEKDLIEALENCTNR
jgi:hypothetical protein